MNHTDHSSIQPNRKPGFRCVAMFLILLCSLFTVACNSDSDSDYQVEEFDYADALVSAFSLDDNDSVCTSLSKYQFTIDHYGLSDPEIISGWEGAGIIFNSDSLPVGSVPDSVVVNLSFSSPHSVLFIHYDSLGTAVDTVDFSSDSLVYFDRYAKTRLEVTAYNETTVKNYFVKVNVHQVEGDTILWQYAAEDLWETDDITAEKTVAVGRDLFWMVERAGETQTVSTASLDGSLREWGAAVQIQSPKRLDLGTTYVWQEKLYAVGEGVLCQSIDGGATWSAAADGYTFVNLLGNAPACKGRADSLFAIVKQGEVFHFAGSADGKNWNVGTQLPIGFPISGYSNPVYTEPKTSLGAVSSRIYIVGGRTSDGTLTSSTWCCDGKQWAEFTQLYLPALEGAQVVKYMVDTDYPETLWILCPGETSSGVQSTLYFSENRGVTWKPMAAEYEAYATNDHLVPTAYHSMVYDIKKHRMYFCGGYTAEGRYTSSIVSGILTQLTFDKRR